MFSHKSSSSASCHAWSKCSYTELSGASLVQPPAPSSQHLPANAYNAVSLSPLFGVRAWRPCSLRELRNCLPVKTKSLKSQQQAIQKRGDLVDDSNLHALPPQQPTMLWRRLKQPVTDTKAWCNTFDLRKHDSKNSFLAT